MSSQTPLSDRRFHLKSSHDPIYAAQPHRLAYISKEDSPCICPLARVSYPSLTVPAHHAAPLFSLFSFLFLNIRLVHFFPHPALSFSLSSSLVATNRPAGDPSSVSELIAPRLSMATAANTLCPFLARTPSDWLQDLISERVDGLRPGRQPHHGECLFQDIGDWLVESLSLFSFVANSLSSNAVASLYGDIVGEEMDESTDFSELSPIPLLMARHKRLRELAEQIKTSVSEVTSSWEALPLLKSSSPESLVIRRAYERQLATRPRATHSPDTDTQVPVNHDLQLEISMSTSFDAALDLNDMDGIGELGVPDLALQSYHETDDGTSPNSEGTDAMETKIATLIASLSERGKGQYQCPYAYDCTKGGVDKDGRIVIFERNSTFK